MHKTLIMNQVLHPIGEQLKQHFIVINNWDSKASNHYSEIKAVVSSVWDAIDAEFIKKLPKLEIISHMAIGYDAVDVEYARSNNIVVTNTPDVVTADTADLAMGLLISLARNIPANHNFVQNGYWQHQTCNLTTSVTNKRLGIVGLGNIGKAIAIRAKAFSMEISYWSRKNKHNQYLYFDSLIALAEHCDFLVICCAANQDTFEIIDAQVLRALGIHGYLINIARGAVVNENDLLQALQTREILGAGLDVFINEPNINPEFFKLDNVILQPHMGTATFETRQSMGELVAKNVINYFTTGKALTAIV